ncbi:MAG: PHP domain-containing protein, partial [Clostridia bacterium]
MIPFVHLHLHTEYSLLDGATRIADVFSRCHDFHMKAVAITDHGNMYGAYQFYCKAEEYYNKNLYKISEKMRSEKADSLYQIEKDVKGKPTGNGEDYKHWQAVKLDDEEQAKARELAEEYHIKPIIGCEFYVVGDLRVKVGGVKREFNHLVILAKNNEGYKNLVKLNSIAFVDGFYYKPRIDFDTLKKYSGGLICLSACLAGQLPRLIMDNRMEDAKALAKSYKDLFQDDYYIELQDHSLPEDRYVNPRLIEIANQLNIELVATNDVHYLNRADSEMHDILLCVQTGKFVDDADRMRFTGTEFYLKNGDEMLELFENTPQALANTLIIADKCNIEIEKEKLLPNYVPPDNLTPAEYLRALIEKGLKEKYTETPEIRERIEYEYNTVVSMGFVEYYLIVWDFIHYAEEQGIPVGPGRGSGAGSIIAYLIGITKVEPLRY